MGAKTSNDKPEMSLGIQMMDDGSIRRCLNSVASVQQRNYVVMEVKTSLIKDERKELYAKWAASGLQRSAVVMIGEPPAALKKRAQEETLRAKQEASDTEFKNKILEAKKEKIAAKA